MAQYLVNALMLGGIYGLIASGFSLVYGVSNILNIAHGSLVMLGGFLTYTAVSVVGVPVLLAIPVVTAVMLVIGLVLHRAVLSLLGGLSIFMVMIFTFGLDMVLQNVAALVWGPVYRTVDTPFRGRAIEVLGAYVPMNSAIIFVSAWAIAACLMLLLSRTRIGLAIQSTALDAESAILTGVDVRWVNALTFAIATGLAGAAGALLSFVYPVYPYMGPLLLGTAFAASVLGGLGSVPGAILAGLILAFVEVGASTVLGAGYGRLMPYVVMVLVLVVRPRGLLGRRHFAEVKV